MRKLGFARTHTHTHTDMANAIGYTQKTKHRTMLAIESFRRARRETRNSMPRRSPVCGSRVGNSPRCAPLTSACRVYIMSLLSCRWALSLLRNMGISSWDLSRRTENLPGQFGPLWHEARRRALRNALNCIMNSVQPCVFAGQLNQFIRDLRAHLFFANNIIIF